MDQKKKWISMLNQLVSGCLFRHGELILARSDHNLPIYVCERCNERVFFVPWK
jgi:hypothetical protein